MIKKRKIGKLKEHQFDLYLRQDACKKATSDLIRELVHEREKAEVYIQRMWNKIYKDYCENLSPAELNRVDLDLNNGDLIIYEDTTGDDLAQEKLELKKIDIAWNKEK